MTQEDGFAQLVLISQEEKIRMSSPCILAKDLRRHWDSARFVDGVSCASKAQPASGLNRPPRKRRRRNGWKNKTKTAKIAS